MENLTVDQINEELINIKKLASENYQTDLKIYELASNNLDHYIKELLSKYIMFPLSFKYNIKFTDYKTIIFFISGNPNDRKRTDTLSIRLTNESNDSGINYLELSTSNYRLINSLSDDYYIDLMYLNGTMSKFIKHEAENIINQFKNLEIVTEATKKLDHEYYIKCEVLKLELRNIENSEQEKQINEFIKDKTEFDFEYARFEGDKYGTLFNSQYSRIEIIKKTPMCITLKGFKPNDTSSYEFSISIDVFNDRLKEAAIQKLANDKFIAELKVGAYLHISRDERFCDLDYYRCITYVRIAEVDDTKIKVFSPRINSYVELTLLEIMNRKSICHLV
jgi:hypothetical protein